jgi:quercetin dioxygenase-like cupin family protein
MPPPEVNRPPRQSLYGQGLPDHLCPCPHWGYMLKGRLRMKTATGAQIFKAGDAFYWGPGHAPEALEDTE